MFGRNKNNNSVELFSAIGVLNKVIVEGNYKICPDCGRIYNTDSNYCTQCTGEALREITISLK